MFFTSPWVTCHLTRQLSQDSSSNFCLNYLSDCHFLQDWLSYPPMVQYIFNKFISCVSPTVSGKDRWCGYQISITCPPLHFPTCFNKLTWPSLLTDIEVFKKMHLRELSQASYHPKVHIELEINLLTVHSHLLSTSTNTFFKFNGRIQHLHHSGDKVWEKGVPIHQSGYTHPV